ncbi:uncharacterized protein LOC120898029 [Anopheles arabiensis]|uniref:uncharacterized protein LOC120898029 n=1 Tax=Anopheles arabiensis TaxID=7173 RepID=UPI001AAD1BC8|nr:uncharacterized protein LOC120898029 [Anopheles arabiensis]
MSLPNNRSMALRRLDCLEKRLIREPELRVAMNAVISEHIKKGYVQELPKTEKSMMSARTWYLPVFPVSRANKPDKIRVVWDAAAEFRGASLNSMFLTGPDLLTPLIVVLRRFREYKIAVAADISEMYHQVRVSPNDHDSQRFLWRWNKDETEPKEYVMKRMTFGAACSPSCAQFVKNLNAERFQERLPIAARCIKEDHYVDDMLTSQEEICDAIKLAKDVLYVHEQGGFPLHNWISNCEEVRRAIGTTSSEQQKNLNLEPTVTTQKVLGMWWDAVLDVFRFKIPPRNEDLLLGTTIPTKRQILSNIARDLEDECWMGRRGSPIHL